MSENQNTYYVRKNGFLYELCQSRFKNNPNHPHNVCAVARSQAELRGMYEKYLSGGVDWIITEESESDLETWHNRFSLTSLTNAGLSIDTVTLPDVPYTYHEIYREIVRRDGN